MIKRPYFILESVVDFGGKDHGVTNVSTKRITRFDTKNIQQAFLLIYIIG